MIQIVNLAKFALAMACFVKNIEHVEDCNFPIIHYALKSECGRKKVRASKHAAAGCSMIKFRFPAHVRAPRRNLS